MESRGSFFKHFIFAVNGIVYALRTQPNIRFHFYAACGVLIFALLCRLKSIEFVLLFFSISLVLVSEMLNTAIETTVNLFSPEYNRLSKIAKDTAAGAVLLAAANSVIVGVLIFYPYIVAWARYLLNF